MECNKCKSKIIKIEELTNDKLTFEHIQKLKELGKKFLPMSNDITNWKKVKPFKIKGIIKQVTI